jgi:hypothetical protein
MEKAFLRAWVDFTYVLCTAFMLVDPKSVKKIDNLTVFFTLLGSAHAKAASKMLMKLTAGVDFTNILRAAFVFADPKSTKRH